ncbi:hypothetical protein [uncultured marine virus]|uniref:CRESS-DNA virus Rep endonuclease domain-containing protein n=1 Tax=uncultured marine virus TaxID=186617 RepID=S4TF51_9VIRU|nr:hypothetical protein [uncultured marine virus]
MASAGAGAAGGGAPRVQGRAWCFTLFNQPNAEEYLPLLFGDDNMQYLVGQTEVCPESGKEHIQGYFYTKRLISFRQAKEMIIGHETSCHIEKRKGTHVQARDYCTKAESRLEDSQPYIFGQEPAQGSRNDLEGFKESVRAGKDWHELLEEESLVVAKHKQFAVEYYQYWRGRKGVEEIVPEAMSESWQKELDEHLNGEVQDRTILWVWSESSATGKTATMHTQMKTHKTLPAKSWREADILYAYDNHDIIWFNIARYEEMQATTFKVLETLSDGGPMLSTKYQSIMKNVKAHIVVTSNQPPPYENLPERIIELKADRVFARKKRVKRTKA